MKVVHDMQGTYDIRSEEFAECTAVIQNLEQYSKMQNLEIIGVQMNHDENVITIATNIASAFGVELVLAEIGV